MKLTATNLLWSEEKPSNDWEKLTKNVEELIQMCKDLNISRRDVEKIIEKKVAEDGGIPYLIRKEIGDFIKRRLDDLGFK